MRCIIPHRAALRYNDIRSIVAPSLYAGASLHLSQKSNSLKYLFSTYHVRTMSSMILVAEWVLYHCCDSKELQSKSLSDILAQFPSEEHELYAKAYTVKKYARLRTTNAFLPLTVLHALRRWGKNRVVCFWWHWRSMSFKLEFPRSNNKAEYEVLIVGLISALNRPTKNLQLKKLSWWPYRTSVHKLMNPSRIFVNTCLELITSIMMHLAPWLLKSMFLTRQWMCK